VMDLRASGTPETLLTPAMRTAVAKEQARLPKGTYVPFGGGRRICLGERFGYLEAKVVVGRILQRFAPELEPDTRACPPAPVLLLHLRGGVKTSQSFSVLARLTAPTPGSWTTRAWGSRAHPCSSAAAASAGVSFSFVGQLWTVWAKLGLGSMLRTNRAVTVPEGSSENGRNVTPRIPSIAGRCASVPTANA
jgi:Cytochrome P450